MSGYHRAYQYVDSAEWERLRRLASSYSQQQSNYENLLKQARKSSAKEIERIRKQSDEQQRRFNQEISQLSAESRAAQDLLSRELRQSREQFANQLYQQQAQFANNLIGVSNELHDRITTVSQHFEEQNSAMRKSIQKERQTREAQIKKVNDDIKELQDRDRMQEQLARQYFADAQLLCNGIRQLPHEQHAPGQLDELEQQLSSARANLLTTAPQAALSSAFSGCNALTELRVDIEEKEERRLQMLATAVEWADALANQAKAFGSTALGVTLQNGVLVDAESIDKSQEIETDDLEREKWSGGALSAVTNEITALQSLLRNDDMFLSQDTIDTIVNTSLPALNQRVNDIDVLAVQNYSLHREKIRIAEIIATQLGADYFEITENSDWAQDNELGDFVIEGVNDLNDKSVVIIGSQSGPDEQARVTIEYFNYRGNEDDPVDARAERVRQSVEVLSQQGVNITSGGANGTEVAAEPDPMFKDVARLQREGVKAVSEKQRATAQGS